MMGSPCVEERVTTRVIARATSVCTKAGHIVGTSADEVMNVFNIVQVVRANNVARIRDETAEAIVQLAPSVVVIPESALVAYGIHSNYAPIETFVKLDNWNGVCDEKRIGPRNISITARFAIKLIDDISFQENDIVFVEQREPFELITRAHEFAVRVDCVLYELHAERFNESSDIGDRSNMVVHTPYYKPPLRENWTH